MLIFMLKMTPSPKNRGELLNILHNVIAPTLIQPGCLACEIYESSGHDQTVLYLEQWNSPTDIHRHIQSALYSRVLAAIDLSAMQPEIKFYEISKTYGMELIESLRTSGAYDQQFEKSSE